MLELYSADIPDRKDNLCVKHSNRPAEGCPRCHVLVEDLENSNQFEASTVYETGNNSNDYEEILPTAVDLRFSRPTAARTMKSRQG